LRGRATFGIVAEPSCDLPAISIRRTCLTADMVLILHVSKDLIAARICPNDARLTLEQAIRGGNELGRSEIGVVPGRSKHRHARPPR
jgi:hypothetical protein